MKDVCITPARSIRIGSLDTDAVYEHGVSVRLGRNGEFFGTAVQWGDYTLILASGLDVDRIRE